MDEKVLRALIGLTGAVNNNGKTEYTDSIVCEAIGCNNGEKMVEKIYEEKYRISPNCATCQSPCGNTSDYAYEKYVEWTKEKIQMTQQIWEELERIVRKTPGEDALPDIAYKAIAYVGYDLEESSYLKLLEEMKKW